MSETKEIDLAIGTSGCADPANFNAELGSRYAVRDAAEKARAKLWELEGWRLKCSLDQAA